MTADDVVVEVVTDIDHAWPDLERLHIAIAEYHEPLTGERLQSGWQQVKRTELRADREGIVAIARRQGRAVGFIDAVIRRDPGMFGIDLAFVNFAYVDPEARGGGVGRKLLAVVEGWCLELGVRRIDLTVRAGNIDGLTAWRAMGFVDDSLRLTKPVGSSAADRT